VANLYKTSKTVDDIIKGSLRIVNAYSDGEEPEVEKMEDARSALNDILDFLETKGFLFFLREWRTRIFEATDVIDVSGSYYRALVRHTSANYTTWAATTTYSEADLVVPTVYNGYYYKCTTVDGGDSGGSEPTFPTNQDATVTDNVLTWEAIPDTKPGVGKDWRSYWYLDSSKKSGATYAVNTLYRRAGDFLLKDDEQSIERSFIRKSNQDSPIAIIRTSEYSDLTHKYIESVPCDLYLEQQGANNVLCHLDPSPSSVGTDGYVFHYLASIRIENYEGSKNVSLPDDWFMAIKWLLASEIGAEFQVSLDQQIYNDKRADSLMTDVMKSNKPRTVTRNTIKSAY